jgi:hypothetical protein
MSDLFGKGGRELVAHLLEVEIMGHHSSGSRSYVLAALRALRLDPPASVAPTQR